MVEKIVNKFNLYERNLYKYFIKNMGLIHSKWIAIIWTELNKHFFHKIFLNYIEVPITTKCSLRCKECSNLIQYYNHGEFFDYKKVVNDIHRLCQITENIAMLRILGGEPLLHPDLKRLLKEILKNKNIDNIQIVTNGTILFRDDIIPILRNSKVSVDISYYGGVSKKYNALLKQLKDNRIKFITNKKLKWTKQSDFSYQNRTQKNLEQVLKKCKLDCISFFDGCMHLCPRSSNGNDLKIFDADSLDFVNLRGEKKKSQARKKLFLLLNKKSIVACNYCKVYKQDELKTCIAGEQISREKALKKFNMIICTNGGNNGTGCMGNRSGI